MALTTTQHNNVHMYGLTPILVIQLKNLLRKGAGFHGDVENLSSEVLTRKLVKDYIQAELDACKSKNRIQANRARTTINATLRNSRAIFSKWARDEYHDSIKLPNLQHFLDAATTPVAKKKYERPPQDLIDVTVEEGRALKKDKPDHYIVFIMAHDIGMRAGEIMAAQKHWLVDMGDERFGIEIKDRPGEWEGPKSGVGRIVPMHKTTWQELQKLCPSKGYLVGGATDYERERIVKRDFSAWMRSIGWDRETYPKAAHELRKLFGCRCITEYANPCVAQKRLGHKYLATTTDYYADYMDDDPALDPLM